MSAPSTIQECALTALLALVPPKKRSIEEACNLNEVFTNEMARGIPMPDYAKECWAHEIIREADEKKKYERAVFDAKWCLKKLADGETLK